MNHRTWKGIDLVYKKKFGPVGKFLVKKIGPQRVKLPSSGIEQRADNLAIATSWHNVKLPSSGIEQRADNLAIATSCFYPLSCTAACGVIALSVFSTKILLAVFQIAF